MPNYNNMSPSSPYASNVGGFYGQGMFNFQCPTAPCGPSSGMGDINMASAGRAFCKECGTMQNVPCLPQSPNLPMNNYGTFPNVTSYYPGADGHPLPSCLVSPQKEETENPPNTPKDAEKREESAPDAPPVQVCGEEPVDEEKEVFVLRIGKKKEGSDKNPKLELEMCTPKGKELKPIPRKETRDTQYDPADAGPEVKGKKGKVEKGKKGKAEKGKAGKAETDKKGTAEKDKKDKQKK